MRRRGFTLYEILVSVAIMASMLALTMANARTARQSSQPHAVADILAGEFRRAHQRALSDHVPVAVVIPSQGNSRPHATSVYFMEGEEKPRPGRVVDFHREYPEAMVSVIHWPLASGATTLDPPTLSDFDFAAWAGSGFQDYAFVYDASGRLHSNLLPNFNGEYHVVASSGLDYASDTPPTTLSPTLNYFSVSRVSQPFTLSLSPSGGIQVTKGLVNAASGVQELSSGMATVAPAPAISLSQTPNRDPVIEQIDFFPKMTSGLTGGATALVDRDGFLTLKVRATDPDGGPLYVTWAATGGAFSYNGRVRMQWSEAQKAWTSTWEWRPPSNVPAGQKFALVCRVADPQGAVVSMADPALQAVDPVFGGKIAFNAASGGGRAILQDGTLIGKFGTGNYQWLQVRSDGKRALWRASPGLNLRNTDGTDPVPLSMGMVQNPSWSPDGSKILYWNLNYPMAVSVMDADGSNKRPLTPSSSSYTINQEPRWANRGDRILVYQNGLPYLVNPDGTALEALQGVPPNCYGMDFSPDSSQMVYSNYNTGVWVCDLTDDPSDGLPPTLTNHVQLCADRVYYGPRWSQRGDLIAFYSSAGQTLKLIRPDGTGLVDLGQAVMSNYSTPSWCR